ncbi:restriction endonuclease [Salsuginibacillus kocurii]|uniref:restriction endonuclease n=1 Tax=Salsuginibacillus kocurii TaxID=427078 RepID=UPI00035C24D1|nr:restriction endonuclease [Salsuginibacillus kocurii]
MNRKFNSVVIVILLLLLGTAFIGTDDLAGFLFTAVVLLAAAVTVILLRQFVVKQKVKRADITTIDQMSHDQFVQHLELVYIKEGYRVTRPKEKEDFGADLILYERGHKIVVLAEKAEEEVDLRPLQEVYAAKAYYEAEEACVITNQGFTTAANKLSQATEVELVDREQLIEWLAEVHLA